MNGASTQAHCLGAENRRVTLAEIAQIKKGEQLNRDGLTSYGTYPVMNGGMAPSGWHPNFNQLSNKTIVSQGGASAGFVTYMETNFWAGAHCYVIEPNESQVLSRFLFHTLKKSERYIQSQKTGAGIPGLNKSVLTALQVNLPTIPKQREIVTVLDTFSEFETELEREIEARKSQYEHYLDVEIGDLDTAPTLRLRDIANVYDGTHQTPTYTSEGVRFVSVENINNLHESPKTISEEDFERLYKIKPRTNDLLMTRIGSVGVTTIVTDDSPMAYYVSLALLRCNEGVLNSRFLRHFLNSRRGRAELRKYTLLNAVPLKINLGDIGKLDIPVPPIGIQKVIASRLDLFEALFKDPHGSLSTELNARRKQFDYYRDQLLSFEEA